MTDFSNDRIASEALADVLGASSVAQRRNIVNAVKNGYNTMQTLLIQHFKGREGWSTDLFRYRPWLRSDIVDRMVSRRRNIGNLP
jgi:hypothetical protein